MRRLVPLAIAMLLLVLLLPGCKPKRVEGEALKPRVEPPGIAKAGELAVGVDLSQPPFAGKVGSQTVGLDVDVAAALAERLGLNLRLVPVEPKEIPAALRDKRIDIALGALPITSELLADAGFAGSYVSDGPAFFSAEEATVTVANLGKRKVGAQKGSLAYWRLESDLGAGFVKAYPTLREAFAAMEAGTVDIVAGDAIVGAYLARDFEGVRFVGQIRPATPLAVAVAEDAAQLEPLVREALDTMAAEGVFDAIRSKWAGDLPELSVATSSAPTP